ncbi:MAG: SpoIIE family protein phosphatase [Chitinispirillia bacterium]|jgi:PAS domain S-box-containing protein
MKDDEKFKYQIRALQKNIDELQLDLKKYREKCYKLQTLIDTIPNSLYIKDTQSRFIFGNKTVAARMHAESPKNLVGKTDFDFIPKKRATKYFEDEQEVIRSGKPLINREEQSTNPEGHLIWILTSKVPLKDDNGNIIGVVGMGRDITELKTLREKERHYLKLIKKELEAGRKIQQCFLPETLIQPNGWDIASEFVPAFEMSGDFYDAFMLQEDLLAITIADVKGKGVGAALFMALNRTLFRLFAGNFLSQQKDPLDAIKETNEYIMNYHQRTDIYCMFISCVFAVISLSTGKCTFINAGHIPGYCIGDNGIKETLKPTGPAVGLTPKTVFKRKSFTIKPGEMLFFCTDGVTEALNNTGSFFSTERLCSIITKKHKTAQKLVDHVNAELKAFVGISPVNDDITMVAVKRKRIL